MKLTDLHIEEFGVLHNLTLPSLPPGFSGMYGPNGSGKSTLVYFLRGALGDKSDPAAASLWAETDRHCGTIGFQTQTGRPSQSVTVRGTTKTKRELLDGAAAARLSTLIATEGTDTRGMLDLARRLGLDLTSETRDKDAEKRYEQRRIELEKRIAKFETRLAEARRERAPIAERRRRRESDWQTAHDRLVHQRRDVRAAVRSADAVDAECHLDHQVAQSDLTEWQTDAWRPRRVSRSSQVVSRPAASVSEASIETALREIARLRCQATTTLTDGYVREADRCDRCEDESQAARVHLDRIRRSLDRGDDGLVAEELHQLAGLIDRHEDTISWLRADRAIALLDRCQRDLLRVRGSLAASACTATASTCGHPGCQTHRGDQIELSGSVAYEHTESIEPPADAERGRRLRELCDETLRAWRLAQRQAIQVRRHLARIDAELFALGLLDLSDIDAELETLDAEVASLEAKLTKTQQKLAALEKPVTRGPNAILDAASDYFRRMTCGNYAGLKLKDRKKPTPRLVALTRTGQAIDARSLSRGTKGQAAIALRLAMLDAIRPTEGEGHWPLVLDDAMVDSDHERMAAGVAVLQDWAAARGGRQVLMLTCQRQLIEAMHAQQVPLRALPGGQPLLDALNRGRMVTRTIEPRRTADETDQVAVAFRQTEPLAVAKPQPKSNASGATPTVTIVTEARNVATKTETSEAPIGTVETVETVVQTFDASAVQTEPPKEETRFWLAEDSSAAELPSIDGVTGRRLATLEIRTIIELIDADAESLAERLTRSQISVESFRRWQSEARLLATIPQLSARDAQLLAYIGIGDADELAAISVSELSGRIERIRSSDTAGRVRLDWDGLSTHRMSGWIERAGRARRGSWRSRSSRRDGRSSERSNRRSRRSRSESGGLSVMERRRAERSESSPAVSATEWKHYLHRSSPVVDAPSIGPKMAKRLNKIGIRTVADLLGANPKQVASRLDDRRISHETVTDWIDQSRLMCRIPQLRGHDAQVLVACGYRTLESLEGVSAKSLFAKVGPFVATKEGKRLLRSSRTPDLAEVGDWLTWSGHARPLKAA